MLPWAEKPTSSIFKVEKKTGCKRSGLSSAFDCTRYLFLTLKIDGFAPETVTGRFSDAAL
jgi:hypothetical protein